MKVELQVGDFITIPNGCKAVIKDNVVVFEKEEKIEVPEFKDGDVLHSTIDDVMLIFKDVSNYNIRCFDSYYSNVGSDNERWNIEFFRHATEEEKKLFFDNLKEKGLKWNAEKKCVEELRWRAKDGDVYFCVTQQGNLRVYPADGLSYDKRLHWFGNYFRTPEHCREAAKRIKETLRNYHEEIGE